jgi:hypothetical protein
MTVFASAYPAAFPQAFASRTILPDRAHAVGTCFGARPHRREHDRLLRSWQTFCAMVGPHSPPGVVRVSGGRVRQRRPLSLSFWTEPGSRLVQLVFSNDGCSRVFACAAHDRLRVVYCRGNSGLSPSPPASPFEGQSRQGGGAFPCSPQGPGIAPGVVCQVLQCGQGACTVCSSRCGGEPHLSSGRIDTLMEECNPRGMEACRACGRRRYLYNDPRSPSACRAHGQPVTLSSSLPPLRLAPNYMPHRECR